MPVRQTATTSWYATASRPRSRAVGIVPLQIPAEPGCEDFPHLPDLHRQRGSSSQRSVHCASSVSWFPFRSGSLLFPSCWYHARTPSVPLKFQPQHSPFSLMISTVPTPGSLEKSQNLARKPGEQAIHAVAFETAAISSLGSFSHRHTCSTLPVAVPHESHVRYPTS